MYTVFDLTVNLVGLPGEITFRIMPANGRDCRGSPALGFSSHRVSPSVFLYFQFGQPDINSAITGGGPDLLVYVGVIGDLKAGKPSFGLPQLHSDGRLYVSALRARGCRSAFGAVAPGTRASSLLQVSELPVHFVRQ
jgi:hypothetical protein